MSFASFAASVRRSGSGRPAALAVVESVPSTNDLGRRLAREYHRDNRAMPAIDILAWRQTAGRGRGSHQWVSPGGAGVWASMVRRIDDATRVQLLPLAVGVGLCRAVNSCLDSQCGLKWPNDVTVDGRKLGGILVEAVVTGELATAIIGFGLNHDADLGRFAAPNPTSIAAHCVDAPGVAAIARVCLDAVDAALAAEPARLVAWFRDLLVHRMGDELRCRDSGGTVEGRFAGVDDRGLLRLETARGMLTFAAAELVDDETAATADEDETTEP